MEQRLAADDQLMLAGLRSPEPTTWRRFIRETKISTGQRRIFDEATDFELSDGFFLPIHQLDGSVACVALVSDRELPEDSRTRAALHMLALYYSFAVRRFLRPPPDLPPKTSLTPRQRECLQWVRAGKTDWEIGRIIGISEHTVIEHLDQARRRLGVKTRTQAVIEAVARGIITL